MYYNVPIGVAYDSYSDVFFWTIDGSLGKVIASQSTMESDAQDLYVRLTNPFSLKLDWVTRRLFWVQDGNLGVMINCLPYESMHIDSFITL